MSETCGVIVHSLNSNNRVHVMLRGYHPQHDMSEICGMIVQYSFFEFQACLPTNEG